MIALHGNQDTATAEQLLVTVREVRADAAAKSICIDIADTHRIDTAAWQVLLAFMKSETRPVTFKPEGSDVVAAAASLGIVFDNA